MNAIKLIEQSVADEAMVSAGWTSALEEEMEDLCTDRDVDSHGMQFWGETPNGDEWRVHLTSPADNGEGE